MQSVEIAVLRKTEGKTIFDYVKSEEYKSTE